MRREINFGVKDIENLTNNEKLKIHYLNDFYSITLNWKKILLKFVVLFIHTWVLQFFSPLWFENGAIMGTTIALIIIISANGILGYIERNVKNQPFNIRIIKKN